MPIEAVRKAANRRCITRSSTLDTVCGVWREVYVVGVLTVFSRTLEDIANAAIVTDKLMVAGEVVRGVVYISDTTELDINPDTDTSGLTIIKLTVDELNTLMRARPGFTA